MSEHEDDPTDGELVPIETHDLSESLNAELPYSDGRVWSSTTVVREIHHHLESVIVHAFEIGRRLIWTRQVLGHGQFTGWCQDNLPNIHERTIRRYMQVAEFLVERPALLKPMARAGLKRALLLTTLAPDQIDRVVGEGHLAETPIAELDTVPYSELQKAVKQLREQRDEAIEEVTKKDNLIAERETIIADLARLSSTPAAEILNDELGDLHRRLDSDLERFCSRMDLLARRWATMSPAVRSRFLGLAAYAENRLRYEQLAWRETVGEEVWTADLNAALQEVRPQAGAFPVPGHRLDVIDGGAKQQPAQKRAR